MRDLASARAAEPASRPSQTGLLLAAGEPILDAKGFEAQKAKGRQGHDDKSDME